MFTVRYNYGGDQMYHVSQSTPFVEGTLYGKAATASQMLISQLNFPEDTFDDCDILVKEEDVACRSRDYAHYNACMRRYADGHSIGIWARTASKVDILSFVIDMLNVDKGENWTGYRITATTNRATGNPVFTLELFAKDNHSTTVLAKDRRPPMFPRVHALVERLTAKFKFHAYRFYRTTMRDWSDILSDRTHSISY